MEHDAPAIFVALEQSGLATAIRQSSLLYPAANVGHIISLVLLAGALAVMDIRLLGGLAATAPGRTIARARNVAIAALAGMVATGFMLFAADASHIIVNPVFQVKLLLIAAGLANVAIYEAWAKRAVVGLAPHIPMPRAARIAGALSLGIWVAVAACGRSIAYF
jgi:hypothetical protein